MKKILLPLGLFIGSVSLANAQATSFGVKAGVSLTNATGDGAGNNTKNIVGFHGGLFANFAINDAFSIQPEVLYSMKGLKSEGLIISSADEITSRLNYIDVPVLARVNAGGLFFELGPQVGFLTTAKQKAETAGGTTEQDIKDRVRTVDFGYAAGLGYQLNNGPGIGLRYNGGFIDTKNPSSSSAVRNSAFQLYLSYQFGGK
jgi:hypothetical protein